MRTPLLAACAKGSSLYPWKGDWQGLAARAVGFSFQPFPFDAHAAFDAAILATYGFSAKEDLLAQLLARIFHRRVLD